MYLNESQILKQGKLVVRILESFYIIKFFLKIFFYLSRNWDKKTQRKREKKEKHMKKQKEIQSDVENL